MRKLVERPHLVFWWIIPVIMGFGFLNPQETLDINIYDTYYVIGYLPLAVLISFLFAIIGLGYWAVRKLQKRLFRRLNFIHMAFTIGGTVFLYILQFVNSGLSKDDIFAYMRYINWINIVSLLLIFGILLSQLSYLVNIVWALLRKPPGKQE